MCAPLYAYDSIFNSDTEPNRVCASIFGVGIGAFGPGWFQTKWEREQCAWLCYYWSDWPLQLERVPVSSGLLRHMTMIINCGRQRQWQREMKEEEKTTTIYYVIVHVKYLVIWLVIWPHNFLSMCKTEFRLVFLCHWNSLYRFAHQICTCLHT